MDVFGDYIAQLYRRYENACADADPRVANWPLIHSYTPTLALSSLYIILVCRIGPQLMENRKPFTLRWLMVGYNLAIMSLNIYIFEELITASTSAGYSYYCQPVRYTTEYHEMRIAKALYLYYISKLVEFIDTFIFVLRKKSNQISFLHVYHHATMFPIWWIGVKFAAGGQSFFGAMINSGVHILMYGYYGVSGLGPHVQKYLWWKRYLTIIQLIQFVVGLIHAVQSLYRGCDFPEWMHWALIIYGASHFMLFMNFYYHSYVKGKRASKKPVVADEIANGRPPAKEIKKHQ